MKAPTRKAKAEEIPISPTHTAVLALLREQASSRGGEVLDKIAKVTDRQLLRMMFQNLRRSAEGTKGMRLTNAGLTIMRTYFRAFECKMPDDAELALPDLLYLDARARMPYHADKEGFVIFETELGMKLKLAEGRVATLIEIEGGWRPPEVA